MSSRKLGPVSSPSRRLAYCPFLFPPAFATPANISSRSSSAGSAAERRKNEAIPPTRQATPMKQEMTINMVLMFQSATWRRREFGFQEVGGQVVKALTPESFY